MNSLLSPWLLPVYPVLYTALCALAGVAVYYGQKANLNLRLRFSPWSDGYWKSRIREDYDPFFRRQTVFFTAYMHGLGMTFLWTCAVIGFFTGFIPLPLI